MSKQKYLIKTLGQYLYQNIKQPWLSAKIQLSYENSDVKCSSSFITEDNTAKIIEIPENIQHSFEQLCELAKTNSPENWQRAIFNIERSGNYSLNFELDPVFESE